jgi:hypothetical protein
VPCNFFGAPLLVRDLQLDPGCASISGGPQWRAGGSGAARRWRAALLKRGKPVAVAIEKPSPAVSAPSLPPSLFGPLAAWSRPPQKPGGSKGRGRDTKRGRGSPGRRRPLLSETGRNSTAACVPAERHTSHGATARRRALTQSTAVTWTKQARLPSRTTARGRALSQSAALAREQQRGGVRFCRAPWQPGHAQQARLVFCRAPWQSGHSRRASASAERLRLAQQQPEHNGLGATRARFARLLGPFWASQSGRAARRVARAPLRTA